MRYSPREPAVVLREIPVSVLLAVTVAPGSTAPDWPFTVPELVAVVNCGERLLSYASTSPNSPANNVRAEITLRFPLRSISMDSFRVHAQLSLGFDVAVRSPKIPHQVITDPALDQLQDGRYYPFDNGES